ncbi:DUF4214 domain-containing protein [Marinobacterium weihaiense]|uniref:DUF4214 domain-containing protein n=1 Tax=Marinobacterium weihaiense TaxID=2851016 RepID=A0ABS6M7U0_9GAMM|nr:DUF4214 domain-containing protein [Marinobacterium weihaiense]MBV0932305.1 DUF4214 domain-containing protein [Marinobacterium weihaiense]
MFEPESDVVAHAYSTSGMLESGNQVLGVRGHEFYRLDVPPGDFSLRMTPDSGDDVNMVLYNGAMQVVASSFGPKEEFISYHSSSSETFFVELYPTAKPYATAFLDVELSSGGWSTELGFGPIRDVPVTLYDIDKDGRDEIFVATSKALDSELNEVRPAGLVVLEDDGSIKWSVSFPAIGNTDPQTGKIYHTTSVSSAPAFADLTGDGRSEIVIGVGADTFGEAGPDVVGQPGDKGGVYALTADGNILWFHQSRDTIGGSSNTGDGRPDGVYGAPVVFDIDGDGSKEVIVNSWDQSTWILEGATGVAKAEAHLADTIWSTPHVADLNGDNRFEILVSADITENSNAGTKTGGIFHVLNADAEQVFPGFDQPVGNPDYIELRGKYEEQALWSSPITADLDGDGRLEILYGTGNFFHDERGSYIRVWDADGSERMLLQTQGRTFATPLVADLNNDGRMEIVAATLDGVLHGWDAAGEELFRTETSSFLNTKGNPIFSAPVAADLTGDGKLEVLIAQGAQVVAVDAEGRQLSDAGSRELVFESFKGAVAVKDIDGDGKLNIISGGNTAGHDQAIVFNWVNPFNDDASSSELSGARYQFSQSQGNIINFVERFYDTVLNRSADPHGLNDWVDSLYTGVKTGADVAVGFVFSAEFTNKAVSDIDYLNTLYRSFFGREPDSAGFNQWLGQLDAGTSRAAVLDGFIYSQEFRNLAAGFGILPFKEQPQA